MEIIARKRVFISVIPVAPIILIYKTEFCSVSHEIQGV